jgi:hypothetical protein
MTFKVKDKIAKEFEVLNLLYYCIFTVWPPTFLFFIFFATYLRLRYELWILTNFNVEKHETQRMAQKCKHIYFYRYLF